MALTVEGAILQLEKILDGSTWRVRGSAALSANSLSDLIANEPLQETDGYQPQVLTVAVDAANPGQTEPEDVGPFEANSDTYQLDFLIVEADWAIAECNRELAAADFSAAADEVTITAHGLAAGGRLLFNATTGSTLPGSLEDGINAGRSPFYYVSVPDANTVQLHATEADAIAGTNVVDISGTAASGTIMVHFATGTFTDYVELASTRNVVPGGATFTAGGFYLKQTDSDGLLLAMADS